MRIFPTPSKGVNFANHRRSTLYCHSAHVPPPNSFQRSASSAHFPYSFQRSKFCESSPQHSVQPFCLCFTSELLRKECLKCAFSQLLPKEWKGGTKMWGNGSPSEGGNGVACGETRLQAVLVAVVVLRTFGKWDENVGK